MKNKQHRIMTPEQIERQRQIAESLKEILALVEAGDVSQLCIAAVTQDGGASTCVVTAEEGFITMIGALEMCKLEVVSACVHDDSERQTH